MNRRGFLGTLMAGIVGTAFAPSEVLWMPSPERGLPVVSPSAFLTLEQITREAAQYLSTCMDGARPMVRMVDGLRIGDAGMTHQFHVHLRVPDRLDEVGLDPTRYIHPMAAALGGRLRSSGCDVVGELPLPMSCVQSCRHTVGNVSVRGILDWDLGEDRHLLRLDVLGWVS